MMSVTSLDKGKGKALPEDIEVVSRSSSRSRSSSSSDSSDSDLDSDSSDTSSDEEITQEYLDSLLEKARKNAARALSAKQQSRDNDDFAEGDEVIKLDEEEDEK